MAELASQNRILRSQILVSEEKLPRYASRNQCHGFDGLRALAAVEGAGLNWWS